MTQTQTLTRKQQLNPLSKTLLYLMRNSHQYLMMNSLNSHQSQNLVGVPAFQGHQIAVEYISSTEQNRHLRIIMYVSPSGKGRCGNKKYSIWSIVLTYCLFCVNVQVP